MPQVAFWIVDSFTRTRFTGNPAGVVLHDGTLTPAQMQSIAGELGLESAFLSPGDGVRSDYVVAYYTGVERIPLCGHDTIAAATVLAHMGRLENSGRVTFSTDVGVLEVELTGEGQVRMTQALPQYGLTVGADEVLSALGGDASGWGSGSLPMQVVSTGTPFLIVPVASHGHLDGLRPDGERLAAYLNSLPGQVKGLYAFTLNTRRPEVLISARCFAPAIGLPEDPVTGSASGAVGAFLFQHGAVKPEGNGTTIAFRTEQGCAMGRAGMAQVQLRVQEGAVTQVQVGGYATLVAEGHLWV